MTLELKDVRKGGKKGEGVGKGGETDLEDDLVISSVLQAIEITFVIEAVVCSVIKVALVRKHIFPLLST